MGVLQAEVLEVARRYMEGLGLNYEITYGEPQTTHGCFHVPIILRDGDAVLKIPFYIDSQTVRLTGPFHTRHQLMNVMAAKHYLIEHVPAGILFE